MYNVTYSNNLLNVVYREEYLCTEDRGYYYQREVEWRAGANRQAVCELHLTMSM